MCRQRCGPNSNIPLPATGGAPEQLPLPGTGTQKSLSVDEQTTETVAIQHSLGQRNAQSRQFYGICGTTKTDGTKVLALIEKVPTSSTSARLHNRCSEKIPNTRCLHPRAVQLTSEKILAQGEARFNIDVTENPRQSSPRLS